MQKQTWQQRRPAVERRMGREETIALKDGKEIVGKISIITDQYLRINDTTVSIRELSEDALSN